MQHPDITAIHRYIAYGSVGASTVRGLRTKGVVAATREALRAIDLKSYSTTSPEGFAAQMNADTDAVRLMMPDGVQFWGVARKVLNIFLRGALYNTYLNAHYALSNLEHCFEIPLDSLSAQGIRDSMTGGAKPRWVGVKNVTPEINDCFQALATQIAAERGTLRVHLDAVFWGGR